MPVHAKTPPRRPTPTPAELSYGFELRRLRERLGHTQSQWGRFLGVVESTVARWEGGTRRPPHDAKFYELLRAISGVSDEDIAALLRTSNAPRWLLHDSEDLPPAPSAVATAPGIRLEMRLYADPGERTPAAAERLLRHIKLAVEDILQLEREQRLRLTDLSGTTPSGATDTAPADSGPPPHDVRSERAVINAISGAQMSAAAMDADSQEPTMPKRE